MSKEGTRRRWAGTRSNGVSGRGTVWAETPGKDGSGECGVGNVVR